MAKLSEERASAIVDKLVDVLNSEGLEVQERLAIASMYFSTEVQCAMQVGAIQKDEIDNALNGCFDIIREEVKDSADEVDFVPINVKGDC